MKRLLLLLLLIASIGCKKELAPQGEQRDYNTADYEHSDGRSAVFMRNGYVTSDEIYFTFTKKRHRSYTIRDGDIIESMDYNTLQTLPAIQVGTTDTDKYYDLEYNPTNNVSSKDGNRYYDRIKFAKWAPINRYYFLE